MRQVVPAFFEFTEQDTTLARRFAEGPNAALEIALRRGMPIFRGSGKVRALSADDVARLVAQLPLPMFDAGPRNRELDEIEGSGR